MSIISTTSFDPASALSAAAFGATLAGANCLSEETEVMTAEGPMAASALRPGDLVLTRDNGFQPVIDATRAYVSAARQSTDTGYAAVTLAPGALAGQDRAITLSAAHPVLIEDEAGETVFVKAVELADAKLKCGNITYIALTFENHEVIFANGAMVASN